MAATDTNSEMTSIATLHWLKKELVCCFKNIHNHS